MAVPLESCDRRTPIPFGCQSFFRRVLSRCGFWSGPGLARNGMGIVHLLVTTIRCPGYAIDHIHALKHGGADEPWQAGEGAKAEDGKE